MKHLIFLLLLFLSCKPNVKQTQQEIIFKNELFKSIVEKYISFISSERETGTTITIICKGNQDSLSFAIVNAFPDLSVVNFNGYGSVKGYRICIVGDCQPNSFFQVKNHEIIPPDIVDKNQESKDRSKPFLPHTEPILWTFYFKGSSLIKYSPVQEISTYCNECKVEAN